MSAADDGWLADQLRAAERGEAAAMTSWRIPRWAPWAFGLWVFSWTGGLLTFDGALLWTWFLLHQGAMLGYLWWDVRRTPSPRGPAPREYRIYYVVVGLLATALLVVLLPTVTHVDGWSGAALAGAACAVFGWLAETCYSGITRTVKERLA